LNIERYIDLLEEYIRRAYIRRRYASTSSERRYWSRVILELEEEIRIVRARYYRFI